MPARDSLEFAAAVALGGILGAGVTLLLRREASFGPAGERQGMPPTQRRKTDGAGPVDGSRGGGGRLSGGRANLP